MRPLAIDLFCGLFGWGGAFDGWDVVGFDLEDMHAQLGLVRPPHCRLVIQDVLTLDGAQFRDAELIVASPPCQAYSYRAMPWKRAKALPPPDNTLFEACFRIQREACKAAGRHIPLIVENVRGAQKWAGRARWAYGSFHLWGDVPALMPIIRGRKNNGGSWFNIAHNTTSGKGQNPDGRKVPGGGAWFAENDHALRQHHSGHPRRKTASALIAKIPLPLARHIGRVFYPRAVAA